jgi:hypothetical protein
MAEPPPAADSAVYQAVVRYVVGFLPDTLLLTDDPPWQKGLQSRMKNLAVSRDLARALQRASAVPHPASALQLGMPFVVVQNVDRAVERRLAGEPGTRKYSYRGVFTFSPVGFSADGARALVEYAMFCGVLCGHGAFMLLERAPDGSWRVREQLTTFVS